MIIFSRFGFKNIDLIMLILSKRLDSNIESKSLNNTYLNIIELLFLI